jgi:hypothetical protein
MRITFSRHALNMLAERQIEADWAVRAIEAPKRSNRSHFGLMLSEPFVPFRSVAEGCCEWYMLATARIAG